MRLTLPAFRLAFSYRFPGLCGMPGNRSLFHHNIRLGADQPGGRRLGTSDR